MLIFFWQYAGEADDSVAPPVTPAGRRYSVHASKGVSTTKGLSRLRSVSTAEGLAHPELTDVDT